MMYLDSMRLCVGNSEPRIVTAWKQQQMTLHGNSDCAVGYLHEANSLGVPTIHHKNCEILLPCDTQRSRSTACSVHQSALLRLLKRKESTRSDECLTSSHSNFRYQSVPQLVERLGHVQHQRRNELKALNRVKFKITKAAECCPVLLDEECNDLMAEIITSPVGVDHYSHLPETSFQRVFWEQQAQAAVFKNIRNMQWHPLMIRWCLSLRHKSASAYEALRDSGCIALPSQRTLRDYTHYFESSSGFSSEVDQMLIETVQSHQTTERDKYLILIIDEMHIREDLVFNKHAGHLVGFSNLGDINEHLLQFEQSMHDENSCNPKLAKSVVAFMVRGLFSKLQFPYAHFPAHALCGDQLYDLLWEAVQRLENGGFKVLGVTMDGCSSNRKLIRLHASADCTHKVSNPFTFEKRCLYFFCDPPHLLKTIRNCWQSRQLWCKGKYILWDHLKELYSRDTVNGLGVRLIPKLKYEHIYLTSFSKMRVDLAAQVLSNTVSKALLFVCGDKASETSRFVDMVDKFFDALNVHNYNHGVKDLKSFQLPYTSAQDTRLIWLEKEFLEYLYQWKKSLDEQPNLKKDEKKQMFLSTETYEGIQITCKSFVELVQYLFTVPEVDSFLSQRLCQDPLERFFGCQRQRGRVNDNPNVAEFDKNTQAIRLMGSFSSSSSLGNCRGDRGEIPEGTGPLHKRRYTTAAVTSGKSVTLIHKPTCTSIDGDLCLGHLMRAINALLADKAFSISSVCARHSAETAKAIAEWIPHHRSESDTFEQWLLNMFQRCIKKSPRGNCASSVRANIWKQYHSLRTSDAYITKWDTFLKQFLGCAVSPICVQYIGHYIFKQLLKIHCPLKTNCTEIFNAAMDLTYEEINAIRYAAGYVPRALKKKVLRSSHMNKDDLLSYLNDLITDGNEEPDETEAWLQQINRGGLIYVNTTTYDLFYAMELELRSFIGKEPSRCLGAEVQAKLERNDDVLFYWSIISAKWDTESEAILLRMTVDLWVTIRGFSITSAWVERYKSINKTGIQKSKGLRKKLL